MTITARTFRWLVGASLFGMISTVVVDFATESSLPPVLQDFLRSQFEADITRRDIMLIAVGLVTLIALAVSYVGLFRIKRWGRLLFLLSNCIGLAMTPFIGPAIYTGLAEMAFSGSFMLVGMVIALSYFTSLFEDKDTESGRNTA